MSGGAPAGLFASLRSLLRDAAALVEVRLQLLASDVQQEKVRLLESLAWLAVALVLFGVGVVLLSVFAVMLFDPRHRLAAVGVLGLLFLFAAGLAWRVARAERDRGGAPFEASLAELRRDRQALGGSDPATMR